MKVNPLSNHIRETSESLLLTPAMARWLHAALGELLTEGKEEG